MVFEKVFDKIRILSNAAKYDVSCASSGVKRSNNGAGLGNTTAMGICHSFAEDGRCVSLLKLMLTNHCIYDCAYCFNRRSNDIERTTFTVSEVVGLTIDFYRRNYIEGLFLSSGVILNPDYTMSQLTKVARTLRTEHNFNAYIHLKSIPGASSELIREAGLYADRLSVNIEIPSEGNLKLLAPEKNYQSILQPMNYISQGILESKEEAGKSRYIKKFSPSGQSTQLIIGATPDNDKQILGMASGLYSLQKLKRVYYSGYISVNQNDSRLPVLTEPPMVREHRLYQADWLMRFYNFTVDEIVNDAYPNLDLELDPKICYALRHPELFPIDINKADYETILRIPGIGPRSAQLIVTSRRFGRISAWQLKKMGVVMKRAKYFITCGELVAMTVNELTPEKVRRELVTDYGKPQMLKNHGQLSLF